MARKKAKPDPLTLGKGRSDEVDQSKGIFPAGVPHPEGAEERTPGELGGGPYEESGRGGVGPALETPTPSTAKQVEEVREEEKEEKERAEEIEPKGALPSHEEQTQKKVA